MPISEGDLVPPIDVNGKVSLRFLECAATRPLSLKVLDDAELPNLDYPVTGGPRRQGPTLSPGGKKASSPAGSPNFSCNRGLAWLFLLPAADQHINSR